MKGLIESVNKKWKEAKVVFMKKQKWVRRKAGKGEWKKENIWKKQERNLAKGRNSGKTLGGRGKTVAKLEKKQGEYFYKVIRQNSGRNSVRNSGRNSGKTLVSSI